MLKVKKEKKNKKGNKNKLISNEIKQGSVPFFLDEK